MPESARQAKAEVAKVEDYDSDESNVIAGTARLASQVGVKESSSSSKRAQPRVSRRDAHSDSGHNSKATRNPATATTAASSRNAVQQPAITPPVKRTSTSSDQAADRSKSSKPVIHRNDSGRTSAHSDHSPQSLTKHTSCTDPYCRDPDCGKSRKQERRKTIVHQAAPPQQHPQVQQYPVLHQYHHPQQYSYATPHDTTSMPPPRRSHAGSLSQPRPVSTYGYGMPLSSSPQQQQLLNHYAGYPQHQMYAPQAPAANMGASYQPASPAQAAPSSPTYPGYPTQNSNGVSYSARQANPSIPGLGPPKIAPLAGAGQYVSARRIEDHHFHDHPENYSSESESVSASDYSSEEEQRLERRPSRRHRASEKAVAVIPHPSRPSVKKYYTEQQTLPTRSRHDTRPRQSLQRSGRSDGDVYYSDEVGDSDRTARAVVARPSYTSSSSRRPSIATTSSSGRTKATTLSSTNTDYSSHGRIIVEGKHGRRTTYLSKEQQAELRVQQKLRDAEEERLRLRESVDAYQKGMQGNVDPFELTAENMRKKDDNRRRSASYISNSRSHRSSASQSAGGIKIQSGDTVLHVFGDAKVEMRAGENGEPASFFIAGGGDGGGSRSSRSGRPRSDVRQRAIREENSYDDGYEVAR